MEGLPKEDAEAQARELDVHRHRIFCPMAACECAGVDCECYQPSRIEEGKKWDANFDAYELTGLYKVIAGRCTNRALKGHPRYGCGILTIDAAQEVIELEAQK